MNQSKSSFWKLRSPRCGNHSGGFQFGEGKARQKFGRFFLIPPIEIHVPTAEITSFMSDNCGCVETGFANQSGINQFVVRSEMTVEMPLVGTRK